MIVLQVQNCCDVLVYLPWAYWHACVREYAHRHTYTCIFVARAHTQTHTNKYTPKHKLAQTTYAYACILIHMFYAV
jgi:hypothetical protein